MELLIPGLILVALMVYASTRIKKRAAAAFEPELIETEEYRLSKPEGFLHVIGSPDHELDAYSKEFDEADNRVRRAKIEVDVFRDRDLRSVVDSVKNAAPKHNVISESAMVVVIEAEETANEIPITALYKIIAGPNAIYRLRITVSGKHKDEFTDRLNDTVESFTLTTV